MSFFLMDNELVYTMCVADNFDRDGHAMCKCGCVDKNTVLNHKNLDGAVERRKFGGQHGVYREAERRILSGENIRNEYDVRCSKCNIAMWSYTATCPIHKV